MKFSRQVRVALRESSRADRNDRVGSGSAVTRLSSVKQSSAFHSDTARNNATSELFL
jgi:hypothetical protein